MKNLMNLGKISVKIKFLILSILFLSKGAFAQLSLPCPEGLVGPENRLLIQLKAGPPEARIDGPATIMFEDCRVDFTEEAVIPVVKIMVKTDAKFIYKKKILFARITKVTDLRCSFKTSVETKIIEGCNLKDTRFSFYRLRCRGIPKAFTRLAQDLIKKEIRKKGEKLIHNLLIKSLGKNEMLQEICAQDS